MLLRTNTFINSVGALAPALPATTTSLTSSLNPSPPGASVTFTATVTGAAASSGTVMFFDAGVAISSAIPLSGSTATFPSSGLASGIHSITAMYSGDASHAGSVSSAVSQDVHQFTTVTTMVAAPEPSTAGASVTLTATVTGTPASPTPTGTVEFFDAGAGTTIFLVTGTGDSLTTGAGDFLAAGTTAGGTSLGTATLSGSVATLVVPSYFAANGTFSLQAVYAGTAAHTGSTSSTYTHTVSAGGAGDITTGLTHHWFMTDGSISGGSVNDSVGSLSLGILGGITSTAGPNATYATARALDGTDGTNLSFGAGAAPVDWNAGPWSFTMWASITNPATAGPSSSQCLILSDDVSGGIGTKFLRIGNLASGPGAMFAGTVGQRIDAAAGVFPANTWVHLVITCSGSGGATLVAYKNGSLLTTTPSAGADITFDNGAQCLGAGSSTDGKLTGKISSTRTYNRALSAADVTMLYNGGAGG